LRSEDSLPHFMITPQTPPIRYHRSPSELYPSSPPPKSPSPPIPENQRFRPWISKSKQSKSNLGHLVDKLESVSASQRGYFTVTAVTTVKQMVTDSATSESLAVTAGPYSAITPHVEGEVSPARQSPYSPSRQVVTLRGDILDTGRKKYCKRGLPSPTLRNNPPSKKIYLSSNSNSGLLDHGPYSPTISARVLLTTNSYFPSNQTRDLTTPTRPMANSIYQMNAPRLNDDDSQSDFDEPYSPGTPDDALEYIPTPVPLVTLLQSGSYSPIRHFSTDYNRQAASNQQFSMSQFLDQSFESDSIRSLWPVLTSTPCKRSC
jgi:hypothetical protein